MHHPARLMMISLGVLLLLGGPLLAQTTSSQGKAPAVGAGASGPTTLGEMLEAHQPGAGAMDPGARAPAVAGATESQEQGTALVDLEQAAARVGPGLRGLVGPLRVLAADSMKQGEIGLALWGQYLTMSDLIRKGDEVTRTRGSLVTAFSPVEFVEGALALRWGSSSSNMTNPELIQSQGDLLMGLKAFGPLGSGFSAGGALGVEFLTGEGEVFWKSEATSARLAALASFDARAVEPDLPLRVHANLGYSFENSWNVSDRRLNPEESFAHGVMAYDTVDLALGVEGLLPSVTPFMEWGLRIPVGTRTTTGEICIVQEKCPGNEGFAANPHWLTLGLRGQPWPGLLLSAALDLGLTRTVASGVAAVPPYNLVFGLSYAIDPTPRVVVKTMEKPSAEPEPCVQPPTGVVRGRVVDRRSRKPIARAIVRFPGHPDRTPLATGEDGLFETYPFPPGKLRIEADGLPAHQPKAFLIDLEPGKVDFTFSLLPSGKPVALGGRVHDLDDMPVPGAQVSVAGEQGVITTDPASGRFVLKRRQGAYRIRVSARGYLAREREVVLRPGERQVLDFLLRPREEMVVVFKEDRLELTRPIHFALGKADIQPDSFFILDQVIDQIVAHDLKGLRIEGHTDSKGDDSFNKTLSQERADAVQAYLVGQGIDPGRLQATGFGEGRPVASNRTEAGRARNRRVEFHILNKPPGTTGPLPPGTTAPPRKPPGPGRAVPPPARPGTR